MLAVVSFLGTTLGRFIAGGALAVLLLGGAYLKGRGDGAARAEATCAAARAAEIGRQMQATTASLEAEKARAEAAEATAEALQQQVDDLTEDVRRRPPASVCIVEKGDVEKLKAIR